MPTIFTRIINGEIPGYTIYEDVYVAAILDIHPIHKGHVLVIPKQEVDQLFDLEDETYEHLMHTVKEIASNIKEKTGCKRVCVIVEGYAVPHAHIHLIPTNSADDLDKSHTYKATEEELEEIHQLLLS